MSLSDTATVERPTPPPTGVRRVSARLVGATALVVLVVAMLLNTKFLTPEQVAAIAPKPFDPAQTAAGLWAEAQSEVPGRAAPLAELLPALQTDVKGAAAKYQAGSPNENAYVFPVTTQATVTQVTDTALQLQVPGLPPQPPVFVPLGTAVNGTVVRDAMGFTFAQAPDQARYQYVGDELKKLMLAQLATEQANQLQGKQITVVGVLNVIAPSNAVPAAKPVSIQPITIKAGA